MHKSCTTLQNSVISCIVCNRKIVVYFLIDYFPPFSRYITFSKEEEAIRCIQSVHGFVLEGNFLRYSHILSWSPTSSTQAIHLSIIVFDDHHKFSSAELHLELLNIAMHGWETWYVIFFDKAVIKWFLKSWMKDWLTILFCWFSLATILLVYIYIPWVRKKIVLVKMKQLQFIQGIRYKYSSL